MLTTNREMLNGYRAAEPAVLTALYRTYRPVVATCLRSTFPFSDGGRRMRFFGYSASYDLEDAIQLTFERAFGPSARAGYDGLRPFETYLRSIARRVVIDEYRRRRRALDELSVEPLDERPRATLSPVAGDPPETPAVAAQRREARALLDRFMATLDAEDRRRIRLLFIDDLDQRTVAERLGMKRSRLRAWLDRLRLRLLRFMKAQGYIDRLDASALWQGFVEEVQR